MPTMRLAETEIRKVKWHTDGTDLGLTLFAGALALVGNPFVGLLVSGGI